MGKYSDKFFVPPPSREDFERYLQESTEVKHARKKESRSGLVQYVETIQLCTNAGMSLRDISRAVKKFHGVHFDYTAIHHFLRRFPELRRRAEVGHA